MTRTRAVVAVLVFCCSVAASGGAQPGIALSGTIATTLSLTSDAELVGNVTCTMTGAPCIRIDAPGVTLRLNGFAITGRADPVLGCSGGLTANEHGIMVAGQRGVDIRGPGIVQRFRGQGILISGFSTKVLVRQVTTSTNCFSGIIVTGGASDNDLEANIAVRNGNTSAPCGGI